MLASQFQVLVRFSQLMSPDSRPWPAGEPQSSVHSKAQLEKSLRLSQEAIILLPGLCLAVSELSGAPDLQAGRGNMDGSEGTPQLRCPVESSGNNTRLQAEGRRVQVTVTKTGLGCQRDPGSVYDRHRAHCTSDPWGSRGHCTGGRADLH